MILCMPRINRFFFFLNKMFILIFYFLFWLQLDHIDQLNVIHVAGTKGKGSTCAFTESILRQYGYKTGFFRYKLI